MRILNIGSLNIDRTYRVDDFVRPGETIKAKSYDQYCGGKGLNQSIALARAGANVWHAGAVGADGDMLVRQLKDSGVNCQLVEQVGVPTGHAVIQVTDDGQNDIIICGGANDSITKVQVDRALDALVPGDMVLLQNETSNVGYALEAARRRGLSTALNPSPMNEAALALDLSLVDLFFLNEVEAAALVNAHVGEESVDEQTGPDQTLALLMGFFPSASFVLTLGSAGSCYASGDLVTRCPAFAVDAVDTTAAGDTFCGYFLAALASGTTPAGALRMASAASALAVTRPGASPSIPLLEEVVDFLKDRRAA